MRLLLAALLLWTLPVAAEPALRAVASFSILADLVRQVGGTEVAVGALVGPDGDAHVFQARPTDARTLARAQALVSNGLGFDPWVARLAEAAGFRGRTIVASAGVAAGSDRHCWQDVACARLYVANIATGLGAADPPHAEAYRARAAAYDQRLAALDSWVRTEIARVPAEQRKAIVDHDALRAFAAAYGVVFHAVRGVSTDSEPSARDVARLARLVREQGIRALFLENMANPALMAEIARETGATLGPRLYCDALSQADGPAPTYEALMRHNVRALVEGMLRN